MVDSTRLVRFRARNTDLLPEPAANDVSHARMNKHVFGVREGGGRAGFSSYGAPHEFVNICRHVFLFIYIRPKSLKIDLYQHTPNHLDRTVRDRPIGSKELAS